MQYIYHSTSIDALSTFLSKNLKKCFQSFFANVFIYNACTCSMSILQSFLKKASPFNAKFTNTNYNFH